MKYAKNGKNHDRLVRLGSGKGVDEAVSNVNRKIESMIEGMNRIDEYLFDRLCIGCNEKEQ
jgi:enolase